MEQPQIILFGAMALAFWSCFCFLLSLSTLFRLGRPVLNKLPSSLGTWTNETEDTDASNEPKMSMDGMTQFMECVGDTSLPAAADAGKQGCSFVADSRCPDVCSNNVEPPDDQMSESEHARRVHQLEKENSTLQQKINWLQHELRQSDACLAFKKDEYNALISAVWKPKLSKEQEEPSHMEVNLNSRFGTDATTVSVAGQKAAQIDDSRFCARSNLLVRYATTAAWQVISLIWFPATACIVFVFFSSCRSSMQIKSTVCTGREKILCSFILEYVFCACGCQDAWVRMLKISSVCIFATSYHAILHCATILKFLVSDHAVLVLILGLPNC